MPGPDQTDFPAAVDAFIDLDEDDSGYGASPHKDTHAKLAAAVVAVETLLGAGGVELPDSIITTEGDLIVGDAAGDAVRLAVGAAGNLFQSDGTTAVWSSEFGGEFNGTVNTSEATYLGGAVTIDDVDVILGTVAGTKIGTAAAQKVAFHDAAPVVQAAHIAGASAAHALNATFSDTEVEAALDALAAKLNAILVVLENKGFTATS